MKMLPMKLRMSTPKKLLSFWRFNLAILILLLSFFSVVVTAVNWYMAIYTVQKNTLEASTLSSNLAYSEKLSATISDFFDSAKMQLAYSSNVISENFSNSKLLDNETDRLRLQTNSFNSVVVVDSSGYIVSTSPDSLKIKGKKLTSEENEKNQKEKKSLISEPYISAANNLITFVTYPIFNAQGKYLGYIGGTIYLKEKNILNKLISQHFYKNGSSVYLISKSGKIIFSKDKDRIGKSLSDEMSSDINMHLDKGIVHMPNLQNVDSLAGLSLIKGADWIVVTAKPLSYISSSINIVMSKILKEAIPVILLLLIFVFYSAKSIASPLNKLAEKTSGNNIDAVSVGVMGVKAWYYECKQLKKSMLIGLKFIKKRVDDLKDQVNTDPMTGLLNRRGMLEYYEIAKSEEKVISLISLDIDRFKKINDNFGHSVGDEVIKSLANYINEASRVGDIVCRVGGEEFIIILPGVDVNEAEIIAERLRNNVAMAKNNLPQFSISAGVTAFSPEDTIFDNALKSADKLLYKSKNEGRNRVSVCRHVN